MTRDEIQELEAGPDLDALIALTVMGWSMEDNEWMDLYGPVWGVQDSGCAFPWDPSLNITTAWLVVEEMHRRGKGFLLKWYRLEDGVSTENFRCSIYDEQSTDDGYAETAPLAICRAALLSVSDE